MYRRSADCALVLSGDLSPVNAMPCCSDLPLDARLDAAEAHCRDRGARLTRGRREVLRLLMQHDAGVKAYQLLDELRALQGNVVAPPTVYRALDFLQEMGLVHRLDSLNAFVACKADHGEHSLLLVCPQCGAVAETSAPGLGLTLMKALAHSGFVVQGDYLEIKALCPNCAKAR